MYKIKNVILPTVKVIWKVIRPELMHIGIGLVKETYKYFKEATPEKIEQAYKQLEQFENDLRSKGE